MLELIAASLTIQLAVTHRINRERPHRILAFTDNNSALSWLLRSNFDPVTEEPHDKVSSDLAWFCMDSNVSFFAQHIKGVYNTIADALSRDFHLNTEFLTSIICSHLPSQHQSTFKIIPHPKKITSWLYSLKCGLTTKKAFAKKPRKSSLHILKNGETTSRTLESEMFGSKDLAQSIKTFSSQALPAKSDKTNMGKSKLKRSSWEEQWKPPSVLYLRPFKKMHY